MPSTNLLETLQDQKFTDADAYLQYQIDQLSGGVQDQIDAINLEQTDQNDRLDALEAQTYPELLRNLADVQITPTIADNGKIVSYSSALDKFVLVTDAAGISDAPDANNYLRTSGGWVSGTLNNLNDVNVAAPSNFDTLEYNAGSWTSTNRLTNAETDIINLNSEQTTQNDRLTDLETFQASVQPWENIGQTWTNPNAGASLSLEDNAANTTLDALNLKFQAAKYQINTEDNLGNDFTIKAVGANGLSFIKLENEENKEGIKLQTSDIQALYITSDYATEQRCRTGFGADFNDSQRPVAVVDVDGDLQISSYNPLGVSQSGKSKIKHNTGNQRAEISENGGAFNLLTRKNLNELDDTIITAPTNGQALLYNGSSWINAANPATGITDVPNDSQNYVRQFNSWQPATLDSLNNVSVATPSVGD